MPIFSKRWKEIGLGEEELRNLQIMLLKNPESGPVIEGSGEKQEKISMSSLYEDLKDGLEQAIEYESGNGRASVRKYVIMPLNDYSKEDIKAVRIKAGMTQKVFAAYMGVSVKTVEAWEKGRIHPSGPALRLFDILSSGYEIECIAKV